MSGPKTSRYTLTAEQRRLLAEQRRIQQETQKNVILLKENRERLKEIITQMDSQIDQYQRIIAETGKVDEILPQIKSTRDAAMSAYNKAGTISERNGLSTLKASNAELKAVQGKAAPALKSISNALQKADSEFREQIDEAISEGFCITFIRIENETTKDISEYTKKIETAMEEIRGMEISPALLKKFKALKEKAAEIDSIDFIENYYAMSIIPFVKECRAYNSLYQEYGAKFENLYAEYLMLTKELGMPQNKYEFSIEIIDKLQHLVDEMQASIQKQEEQAYISKCVDIAMREMGYKMVGERHIAKKDSRKFTNELFLFDEGTAVNVTYSNDGQITMELGGLDNQDRLPDEAECQSLSEDMEAFCTDYLEIEKKLKAMGVITHRVSILPPDAQFAQIINTSDYQMKESVDKYEVRKKRKAASGQQQLRKGE